MISPFRTKLVTASSASDYMYLKLIKINPIHILENLNGNIKLTRPRTIPLTAYVRKVLLYTPVTGSILAIFTWMAPKSLAAKSLLVQELYNLVDIQL